MFRRAYEDKYACRKEFYEQLPHNSDWDPLNNELNSDLYDYWRGMERGSKEKQTYFLINSSKNYGLK